MSSRLTILVSGMIAADPWQGGATWAVLQYLLGFRELGHDVYFIEPVKQTALRPAHSKLSESENVNYFRGVVRDFGLESNASLLLAGTSETIGLPYEQLVEMSRRADLLVNISGMLTDPQLIAHIPARIYLDLDPGFVQLWHAVEKIDMRFAGHTHFVTVGQNVGRPDCSIPTCGQKWIPTLPPIVLKHWPVAKEITLDAFTTIGNWRGYGSIEHDGKHYGQKAHSFRQFIDLPKRTLERFMPALSIHTGDTKDLAALPDNGWNLLDPSDVASTPQSYQRFIQNSKAEFSVAKSGYVVSNSGWFSDRSACYLASGKPVIAQETGFSERIKPGAGLFFFSKTEEILAAIDAINRDYVFHSAAARSVAERYFDSNLVLPQLLRDAGVIK
jgi:hypothetical protein